MTKRIHPAESSRKLVGVASGVALVGIVTGFQVSANAEEANLTQANSSTQTPSAIGPSTGQPVAPATEVAPEAVPAPAEGQQAPAVQAADAAAPPQAPAAVAPVEAAPAAPAPVAPAVPAAPAAPVNGTTAGSGG